MHQGRRSPFRATLPMHASHHDSSALTSWENLKDEQRRRQRGAPHTSPICRDSYERHAVEFTCGWRVVHMVTAGLQRPADLLACVCLHFPWMIFGGPVAEPPAKFSKCVFKPKLTFFNVFRGLHVFQKTKQARSRGLWVVSCAHVQSGGKLRRGFLGKSIDPAEFLSGKSVRGGILLVFGGKSANTLAHGQKTSFNASELVFTG